jgi:flagellar basal-body rod protein FlgB
MFSNLTKAVDFQSKGLVLRAERQRVIASNIANADTPGYSGRDFDFKKAMADATEGPAISMAAPGSGKSGDGTTHIRHIPITSLDTATIGDGSKLAYTIQTQPAMDGNSVDLDRERAAFVDNSVRYEATLRFINGSSRTILSAIQGQ